MDPRSALPATVTHRNGATIRTNGRRKRHGALIAALTALGLGCTMAGWTAGAPVAQAAVSSTIQGQIRDLANLQVGKACSAYYGSCTVDTKWCAIFARWVWNRANATIEYNPTSSAAASFYSYGTRYGTFSVTPHLGDAVVFYDSNNEIHHVAIVVAVTTSGSTQYVTSVGGNEGGTDGLTSRVMKDTYVAKPGTKFGPDRWVKGYVSPINYVTAAVTPASQTVVAGHAATWTVSWSGGSGSFTLAFDYGDGTTGATWTATGAGSKTLTHVMSAWPCPGDPRPTFTQKFTATDSKYTADLRSASSTTGVGVGTMC